MSNSPIDRTDLRKVTGGESKEIQASADKVGSDEPVVILQKGKLAEVTGGMKAPSATGIASADVEVKAEATLTAKPY